MSDRKANGNQGSSPAKIKLTRAQYRLASLEEVLDTVNLRELTENALAYMTNDLYTVLNEIRATPKQALEAVLSDANTVQKNLYEAYNLLSGAEDSLVKNGRTKKFYENIRKCQNCLIKVLNAW